MGRYFIILLFHRRYCDLVSFRRFHELEDYAKDKERILQQVKDELETYKAKCMQLEESLASTNEHSAREIQDVFEAAASKNKEAKDSSIDDDDNDDDDEGSTGSIIHLDQNDQRELREKFDELANLLLEKDQMLDEANRKLNAADPTANFNDSFIQLSKEEQEEVKTQLGIMEEALEYKERMMTMMNKKLDAANTKVIELEAQVQLADQALQEAVTAKENLEVSLEGTKPKMELLNSMLKKRGDDEKLDTTTFTDNESEFDDDHSTMDDNDDSDDKDSLLEKVANLIAAVEDKEHRMDELTRSLQAAVTEDVALEITKVEEILSTNLLDIPAMNPAFDDTDDDDESDTHNTRALRKKFAELKIVADDQKKKLNIASDKLVFLKKRINEVTEERDEALEAKTLLEAKLLELEASKGKAGWSVDLSTSLCSWFFLHCIFSTKN